MRKDDTLILTNNQIGWYIDYIRPNHLYCCGFGSGYDGSVCAFPNEYSGLYCLSCIDEIIDIGDCDLLKGGF